MVLLDRSSVKSTDRHVHLRDRVVTVLIDDTLLLLIECGARCIRPPGHLITVFVERSTDTVEAVCDLMTHDRADALSKTVRLSIDTHRRETHCQSSGTYEHESSRRHDSVTARYIHWCVGVENRTLESSRGKD